MDGLFVDANIILDVWLNRNKASVRILKMGQEGKCKLYISESVLVICIYFLSQQYESTVVKSTVLSLLKIVDVIPSSESAYCKAMISSFSDPEDAIQYYVALSRKNINYFITRNVKDFKPHVLSALPVLKPEDYLQTKKIKP